MTFTLPSYAQGDQTTRLAQVAEWVARILAAGDAFAGPDAGAGLRALLTTQVRPYHPHQAYPLF